MENKIIKTGPAFHEKHEDTPVSLNERSEMQQQQNLYFSIINSSEDAILSKELNGTITSWNKGACNIFGYTSEEIIGKNISLLIPPHLLKRENEIIEKLLKGEIVHHYETERLRKDGNIIIVSITISSIKDSLGNITGASKILRDITAKKETEKQLSENLQKLETANQELEAFSYSVSHDLRAPLRAVNGYAKMLKRNFETQLDPEANRLMNNIMLNALKMGRLIDDLLSFSRIGRKELEKNILQVDSIVENICTELKAEQNDRDIKFSIGALLPAPADHTAIKQVWFNLISNAIKYSGLKDKTVIEIGSRLHNHEIIYFIKDNGAGFDMRYADKLFGVFQRLHADDEFEGTGVGLAIVQRIIVKHGGRVWAEGKINEGATFYFTLLK